MFNYYEIVEILIEVEREFGYVAMMELMIDVVCVNVVWEFVVNLIYFEYV